MRSKLIAYLMLIFLGVIGIHKFYVNKNVMGVVYIFTAGLFGIGLIYDLFTLWRQVELYNYEYFGRYE